jgi:hypothetical protein
MQFKIKGIPWKLRVLPVATYHRLHGKDSHAMTIFPEHTIDVECASFNSASICHELGHAYFSACMTDSADLSPMAVEEIFCEIIGNHISEIINLSRRIIRTLGPEATLLNG